MKRFTSHHEAAQAWRSVAMALDAAGIVLPEAKAFMVDGWERSFELAMDAQPTLVTTPNSGIPAFLTTIVDPSIIEVLQAPVKAAKIAGEVRKGSWVDKTAMFPVVENTGEVSAYGDFTGNGRSGANTSFEQRQSYLFQTVVEYGELEMEQAGAARIAWAAQLQNSGANNLMRFANKSYFLGINGLQNYGLLNDPSLSASLTPATKAAGGTAWLVNGAPNATANEVYNDVLAIFQQLVTQSAGYIDRETPMVLAAPTAVESAFGFTNTFGLVVRKMLQEEFPNLRIETAVQYQAQSASNPQGNAAGNLVQLIAEKIEGDDTVYCAFNEKMRSHPVIRDLSSFKQKRTSGTWGAIIRRPMGIASMLGV